MKECIMSASPGMKFGAAATVFSLLLAAVAVAQQVIGTPRDASQARDDASNQAIEQGQTDRPSATQSERSTTQRYTANFRGAPTANDANKAVEQFLASCLLQKNQAEIEFSQLAAKQSQNPQVKQFAQQMVEDHQQLVQQLQPLAASARAETRGSTTRTRTDSTSSLELGTGDTDATRTRTGEATRDTVADASSDTGRTTIAGSDANLTATSSGGLHQLASIEKQIGDRSKQAVMDELQQKQGAEFDKCYMGVAIGAHVHMNAALEVIGQQNVGQLSQIAQQAQPKVQQHLDHAKQIKQQLEGQSSTRDTSRAQRPTDETQR
jgi:predicted outer membrane protein